jgi:hypothetical protein
MMIVNSKAWGGGEKTCTPKTPSRLLIPSALTQKLGWWELSASNPWPTLLAISGSQWFPQLFQTPKRRGYRIEPVIISVIVPSCDDSSRNWLTPEKLGSVFQHIHFLWGRCWVCPEPLLKHGKASTWPRCAMLRISLGNLAAVCLVAS